MDKKVEALAVHPAAEAYRMFTEDELAGLAADIKAHGLLDAITVGVLGEDRFIVDGRNRFKACEIAGIPPRYDEVVFQTEDQILDFVWSRGQRRNVSKGQQAIALAMLYPDSEKGGRGKKGVANTAAKRGGFSADRLLAARAIVNYSRELAVAVREGSEKFDDVLKKVDADRTERAATEALRGRLQREAPDLLDMVDEERLSLREGIAALDERQGREKQKERLATSNISRVVIMLHPRGADPKDWAAQAFGHDIIEIGRRLIECKAARRSRRLEDVARC